MRKIRSGKDEERIYAAQEKEIEKKHGRRIANNANYGWFVDAYAICTKVYGTGMVLTSGYEGKDIIHTWEER